MVLGSTQRLIEMSIWGVEGKDGRCVGLTTLPPSCADCLEIWELQPPGTLRVCNGMAFYWLSAGSVPRPHTGHTGSTPGQYMVLGSTQRLIEMSIWGMEGKGGRCVELTILPP
jgi:hypothetical protein